MTRKRRMFDIEMPEDPPETFPAGKVEDVPVPGARRGPMATAIGDTARHAAERKAIEAEIRAENDALAHEFVQMRTLGLVMELVDLDQVETYKLVRDRKRAPDMELAELKESIRSLGLSNPIRLEARPDGKYELIQGYRRLCAYRELHDEAGDDDRFARIPAVVTEPGDRLEDLYRKMVDENLVRKDISFAEMAQMAIDYTAAIPTEENDPDKAVAILYKSAGYQKRSYIRTFIKLMRRLGDDLRFAEYIPRSLGLTLVARMEEDDDFVLNVKRELKGLGDNRSVRAEIDTLRAQAKIEPGVPDEDVTIAKKPKAGPGPAKTSFQFDRREGRAKCTAANGRLELRLGRDFTTIDRRKLERAVRLMLDELDR